MITNTDDQGAVRDALQGVILKNQEGMASEGWQQPLSAVTMRWWSTGS